MRRLTGCSLSLWFGLCGALGAQDSPWLTDLEKAKSQAKEKHLAVLAYFTGSDWNQYCLRYQAEVFSQKDFLSWAEKHVVLLEVDTPRDKKLEPELVQRNEELKKSFKITGLPTVLFLDAEGAVKAKVTGLISGGPAGFIKEASKYLAIQATPAEGSSGVEKGKDEPKKDAENKEPEKKEADPKEVKSESPWITSYADALALAKKQKKLVLADFTGSDWCVWCKRLKEEVFDKPEFLTWAEKNVILLELDYPRSTPQSDDLKKQNEKLAKDFKVEGYPTILFLDASGKKVGQSGYKQGGPPAWLKSIEKIMKKAHGG